jgi:hypothetical protein
VVTFLVIMTMGLGVTMFIIVLIAKKMISAEASK